jgi:hypothetical protein
MKTHHEPAREIDLIAEPDVLVCGAGPAGVAAALAAARSGARTCLLESQGCLGGVWTSGALAWVLDNDQSGLLQEIFQRLDAMGARQANQYGGSAFDAEKMKGLLEEMCQESGVEIRLYTHVVAAARNADQRLSAVVTESKSGREAWSAGCYVDATGDGDLAAWAGCGFNLGHPDTGLTQPMSMLGVLTGIRASDITPFLCVESNPWPTASERLVALWQEQGIEPSYGVPVLFKIHEDLFVLMANHEYGASALDAGDLTRATLNGRREVHRLVDALCQAGGPWQHLRLITTSPRIGTREGRRIHGHYQITRQDLIEGARHPDAVCRCSFPVDVHSPDPADSKDFGTTGVEAKPYDIPLRALIARDIDGLLLAGRCISGDFLAHSSYRVTGTAVGMGQAAGVTAALAAAQGVAPHQLAWEHIRSGLAQLGWLPPGD